LASAFRPKKISYKLLLILAPIYVAFGLVIAVKGPRDLRRQAVGALVDKTWSIGRMIAHSLGPALFSTDTQTAQEIITSARRNQDLAFIVVADINEETVASWNIDSAGGRQYLRAGDGLLSADGRLYSASLPVSYQGQQVGRLYLAFSLDENLHNIASIKKNLILLGIAFFGVILAFLLSLLITRPLGRVAETADRIARGDMSRRAPVGGDDEVGRLARAFNTMIQNLEQTRLTLEKRVDERTKELQTEIGERRKAEAALHESEKLFRSMVESLGEGVGIFDPNEQIQFANPAAHAIFRVPDGSLHGSNMREYATPEHYAAILEETQKRRRGASGKYELEILRPDGSTAILLVTAIPRLELDGSFAGSLAVFADITERKKDEEAVKEANEKLEQTVRQLETRTAEMRLLSELYDSLQPCEHAREIFDLTGQYARKLFPDESGGVYVLDASRTSLQLEVSWGSSPPRVESFPPEDCWALRRGKPYLLDGEGAGLICSHVENSGPGRAPYICIPLMGQRKTLGLLHIRGDERFWKSASTLVFDEGRFSSGKIRQSAEGFAERIALALTYLELSEALRQKTVRDPLTGLFNRRYLEETFEREIARATRQGYPLGVIMLDIDYFKQFNDTYGHEAGDLMLKALAAFLHAHVRREDVVCRYGGEEFTIVLPGSSREVARQRAVMLQEKIEALKIDYLGHSLGPISLSQGVAVCPDDGETGPLVLKAADAALLRAKKSGRAQIFIAGE